MPVWTKTNTVLNILSPKYLRQSIKIGRCNWSYLDNGEGDELWLAFHGYGQEAEVMMHFMKSLRPNARVLSFDLPLHGQTVVEKGFLKSGDLAELLGKALIATRYSQCSLVGFSLGGKLVLKLIELVPGKIDHIVLIAPDGLKVNRFYWLATHTFLGRALFQIVIRFPAIIQGPSKLFALLRVMDPKVQEFVSDQMGSEEKRQKVYDTWQIFKEMTPNLDDVRKKIWRYRLKPNLIFGKNDRVIHPKLAKKLSGENCKSAKVILLDAGHHLTTKLHAEFLRDQLQ